MALDFDQPPLYDYLTKDENGNNKDRMSDVWIGYYSSLYQTLLDYLGSSGFFLPNLTTAQISSLTNPVIGQMLFNVTVDAPQTYTSTGWKTFTIV